ncbi:MAG: hypothetical protein ALMCE001_09800 [Methanocorpusculum sp. MCE]|nr:MAG: hypothetical protein ALMCE001_09800 [Methanocorpusculum sp. MCE]
MHRVSRPLISSYLFADFSVYLVCQWDALSLPFSLWHYIPCILLPDIPDPDRPLPLFLRGPPDYHEHLPWWFQCVE